MQGEVAREKMAQERTKSNIQKQDQVLAKRVKTRVQQSWAKYSKQNDWLTYGEYLETMKDLLYRKPGDEALERETENLWHVMTSA